MLMLMNEWMMLVLMQMQIQSASLTLGCYIRAQSRTDHQRGPRTPLGPTLLWRLHAAMQ